MIWSVELGGVVELAIGMDDGGLHAAIQRAGGLVDVGGDDRVRQRVDADLARGQRVGIGLDAHGIFRGAEHLHLGHAVDGGNLARQQGLGIFVQRGAVAACPNASR